MGYYALDGDGELAMSLEQDPRAADDGIASSANTFVSFWSAGDGQANVGYVSSDTDGGITSAAVLSLSHGATSARNDEHQQCELCSRL